MWWNKTLPWALKEKGDKSLCSLFQQDREILHIHVKIELKNTSELFFIQRNCAIKWLQNKQILYNHVY